MRWKISLLLVWLATVGAATTPSPAPRPRLSAYGADWPVLSADGRILAYLDTPEKPSSGPVIRVIDRLRGDNHTLTFARTGGKPNGWSFQLTISSNGRFLAFASLASNLIEGDTNGQADIFVHDLLTGTTEQVSRAFGGGPADGWSAGPSLSADGRFVAFSSSASNLVLDDTNQAVDVFLHDRLTGQTRRMSVASDGVQSSQNAGWVTAISADGRLIAFTSRATDLSPGTQSGGKAIYLHNRVTGETLLASRPPNAPTPPSAWQADWPSLSADGRYLAYTLVLERPQAEAEKEVQVLVLDLKTGEAIFQQPIQTAADNLFLGPVRATLSGDARRLAVVAPDTNVGRTGGGILHVYDLTSGESLSLPDDRTHGAVPRRAPWLAQDGGSVAFLGAQAASDSIPPAAIQVLDLPGGQGPGLTLSGQVTDGLGVPLASVKVSLGERLQASSDRRGVFYIGGIPPGSYHLVYEKEGYRFEPNPVPVEITTDLAGQQVSARPEELLEEARLDLGMPYSFYRGCDSPYIGCDGPYHGFKAGYCTDLVLDAYRWGVNFHIQYGLDRDARANPGHFYRWGNARNSHDMWRYFSYTGQTLAHAEAYLPGDIVFFDWDQDAVMDHVALVDTVDADGRPLTLLDATGVIAGNPNGLAAELPWEGFHESSVWGHARWQGSYGAVLDVTPPDLQVLQVALDSPDIEIRLVDEHGRELTARGARPSASHIPGGQVQDIRSGAVLAVLAPYPASQAFMVELVARQDSDYYLHLKVQQGGWTTTYQPPRKAHLAAGQVRRVGLLLEEVQGELIFHTLELEGGPAGP